MKIYQFDAVVVGSGCAGYNCADCLFSYGTTNIALVTEGQNIGTSRNTGSDKQTYYKLSLSGDEGDSVYKMAKTLFDGGAMDGDIALCEAANSTAAFMKLVGLGVPFPTNEFGEYVGYKTDHDPFRRATSVGPYTSKLMTEALEKRVAEKGIPVMDKCQIIKILTENGAVTGMLGVRTDTGEFVAFKTANIVLATGGPAALYADSVYPASHTGTSSLAWEAGAEFVNVAEWQYGIASVDFRWNVSGSYQQVLPRYISVDKNGVEREFLLETLSVEDALRNVFYKGYEWPFDVQKLQQSSCVDLLVYQESVIKGRTVYLDFTKNPTGLENGYERLDKTAREYLENSDALRSSPIERLKALNPSAVSLYLQHGIDLEKQPLKIAVCAQHCNGGVRVNKHWQTSVQGLYACGEVAGTFGVFRPGGTALNSTQVGSMRAAQDIAYRAHNLPSAHFDKILQAALQDCEKLLTETRGNTVTLFAARKQYQTLMSKHFAFLRNVEDMQKGILEIQRQNENFTQQNVWKNPAHIAMLFKNKDVLTMQEVFAVGMLETAKRFGSRGSSFVYEKDFLSRDPVPEKKLGRKRVLVLQKTDGRICVRQESVRPLPKRELWFEKAWAQFNKERGLLD